MEIKFVETKHLKQKPDVSKIGFGTHFTDYMFVMDYDAAQGWHDARIVPHEKFCSTRPTPRSITAKRFLKGSKLIVKASRPSSSAQRIISTA